MKNSQKKVIEQWYILPLILVASSVSKLSLGQFGYNCVISFISFLCHLQSIQSSRLLFSVVKHEVVGVVGSSVSVPCNCTPSYSNTRDSPVLILWYKDRAKLPIYRSVRRINPYKREDGDIQIDSNYQQNCLLWLKFNNDRLLLSRGLARQNPALSCREYSIN